MTLKPEEYLERVRALLPGIRARAVETEELGRLPEATVRELDEVGVFRGLQPRQWGGLELDPVTFFESIILIGSACGSTGWVAGVLGAHPWELALLSEEAQRDVWGDDPRTRISSSYAATGSVRRVEGGFSLSGAWHFSSGVDLSDWAFLGGTPEGEPSSEARAYLVSAKGFRIDPESWQVTGLRGTGSRSVHLEDAFVPAHRSHRLADPDMGINPGWEVNDRPLYHQPWMQGIFSWAIAAPAIGAATGAVEAFCEQSASRVSAFGGPPVAENMAVQQRLAQASSAVEDARLRMRTTQQEFHDLSCTGEPIPAEARARSRYEAARAITASLHATLDVFEVAGGSVMNVRNPIQRLLRDLLGMRNHPMGALETQGAAYARELLGLPPAGSRR